MPQTGLTEEQAYQLALKQREAKEKGLPVPPPPVRVNASPNKPRMTEDQAYQLALKQREANTRNIKMKSGMSYGMGNTSKSVFGPPKAPMTGGDTLNFLRGMQGTPLGKALAYGVSLVEQSEKKGQPKDRSEYMRLLSGSEEFRKLPPDGQQQVRLGMQQWFQTQSRFNPSKAMQVKKDEELNRQKAGAKQAADMISIF